MDNDEKKMEENKRHNAPFLAAFKHMLKVKNTNQKYLANMMNTNSSLISAYKKGVKRVSDDMMGRLLTLSGGTINRRYLEGKSQYMLIVNVPDDEMVENAERENPDYEVMKKQSIRKNPDDLNQNEVIDELRDRIAFLESQLAEKDRQIAGLIAKIGQPVSKRDYPFGVGSAETLEMNK